MEQYPIIDLSRMLEHPRCAIRLSSEEEALALLYNAKQQFPERTETWSYDNTYWHRRDKRGICYTMFHEGDTEPTNMSYTGALWFYENGYEVIDFADLMSPQVEIAESDMSIDTLLGRVV